MSSSIFLLFCLLVVCFNPFEFWWEINVNYQHILLHKIANCCIVLLCFTLLGFDTVICCIQCNWISEEKTLVQWLLHLNANLEICTHLYNLRKVPFCEVGIRTLCLCLYMFSVSTILCRQFVLESIALNPIQIMGYKECMQ